MLEVESLETRRCNLSIIDIELVDVFCSLRPDEELLVGAPETESNEELLMERRALVSVRGFLFSNVSGDSPVSEAFLCPNITLFVLAVEDLHLHFSTLIVSGADLWPMQYRDVVISGAEATQRREFSASHAELERIAGYRLLDGNVESCDVGCGVVVSGRAW